MQKISIGESDFKNLITKNYYYIDKTLFIKNILDDANKVVLITRPRRFGKTLNMTTLRYYIDKDISNAHDLFKGLKIMQQGKEYTSKLGYYPCIYMTFKDVRGANFDEMLKMMKIAIYDTYMEHIHLLNNENIYDFEKVQMNNVFYKKIEKDDLISSIKNLCNSLYRINNKHVFLIIDEYDVPLQNAYVEGFYNEAVKFFKEFYSLTFKDNTYLEKTVITGVSRIAKESIFSRCK